jgi:hypothetical protein
MAGQLGLAMEERFWNKVDIGSYDECWEWQAGLYPDGYGKFRTGSKMERAHRIVYEMNIGKIPEGLLVIHSCDNRKCVNPGHLRVGTMKDNARDCKERGRMIRVYGERCSATKLSAASVAAIREMHAMGGVARKALAQWFNITCQQVGQLILGKSQMCRKYSGKKNGGATLVGLVCFYARIRIRS